MANTRLKYQLIESKYPCCGGKAKLQAIELIPRERYVRSCPTCGQTWDIVRSTLRSGDVRIDKLEWEGRNK